MTSDTTTGRVNQKRRTYNAILQAAGELVRANGTVTMPEVAKRALVSEATAYRYFPDLATLLQKVMAEQQPEPAEVLASVAGSADPVERVAAATEWLLRHVLTFEKAVRATIAATIGDPADAATTRRGLRFTVIDYALTPLDDTKADVVQLKRDLTIVIGAESLFCLMDQCGLSADEAIASIVHTAATLTRRTVEEHAPGKRGSRR